MHAHRLRRRVRLTIPVLLGAALLAVAGGGAAVASAHPATLHLGGTWSGTYSGAFSGTFTLRWTQTGSKLTGTIALSNPRGRYGISGSVHRSAISFGAVSVGATYTGSVSGTSMSGSWKSPQGGGKWSAHKLKLKTS